MSERSRVRFGYRYRFHSSGDPSVFTKLDRLDKHVDSQPYLMADLVHGLQPEAFEGQGLDARLPVNYANIKAAASRISRLTRSARRGVAASYTVRDSTFATEGDVPSGVLSIFCDDDNVPGPIDRYIGQFRPDRVRRVSGWLRLDRLTGHTPEERVEAGRKLSALVLDSLPGLLRGSGITDISVSRGVAPQSFEPGVGAMEELVGANYFTSSPNWHKAALNHDFTTERSTYSGNETFTMTVG